MSKNNNNKSNNNKNNNNTINDNRKKASMKQSTAVNMQTNTEKKNTTSSFITFSVLTYFGGLIMLTIEDAISELRGDFSPGFSLYFFLPIVFIIYRTYMIKSARNDAGILRKLADKLVWLMVGYLNATGIEYLLEKNWWIVAQGSDGYMNGSEYGIFFLVSMLVMLPVFILYDLFCGMRKLKGEKR